jgi:ubiquinone/menaquinone biosynthesis C-methylase UbiE
LTATRDRGSRGHVGAVTFYEQCILPHLVHWSMRQPTFKEYRSRVLQVAEGCVLEIGLGSGLSLPFYGGAVKHVIGLEPSPKLLSMARGASNAASQPVELLQASAEAIPLESDSVDTVVSTWTLCSIPDVVSALSEIRRVLKADGRLLFVEHGLSPDPRVSRWQDRLTPLWKRIAGGCHLNRPIAQHIEGTGFRLEQIHTSYMTGPRPMTFMYEGAARVI